MGGALVEIRSLTYQHPGGAKALDDISLQVPDGESLAILGPNGSGKTTLLLHLVGILNGEGLVRVAGLDVERRNLSEIRRRVGLVFQDAEEQLFMPTVLEDVMFGPLNLGCARPQAEQRARAALCSVGLGAGLLNRAPFHLSAGEKRRVAIAGVLAMEPQLLLLDEPTTSLDPPGQRALLELLRSLPQPKIIATHDACFAAALSRRAIFLQNGRLRADGEIEKIVQEFAWNPYS
jgi:cobalt/nickel transport system ATP-binding protein